MADVFLPPVVATGPVGGGEVLLVDPPVPSPEVPQVSLGSAAPAMPTPGSIFADMGLSPPPEQGTYGSLMGQAAAEMFPTVARMKAPGAMRVQPREPPSLLAAAAAPSVPAVAGPPPSALELERAGAQGQLGSLYSLLATPIQSVRTPNAKYPIVQRQKQRFYGGGKLEVEPFKPQPFKPLPRNEGENDADYADRMKFFEDVDLRQQREAYDRQVAEAEAQAQELGDVRDIGKRGHLGMGEAQLQAAEGIGQAELQQLEATAHAQRVAAEAASEATARAQEADRERREQAQLQLDALTHLQGVQTKARERLQALPEQDPDRYFKTMKGGAKLAAIFGAIGGGFGGGVDVAGTLMQLAERDLQTQKANAMQVQDKAAAADDAVARQVGLYQDLLRSAGDEQAADAMWLQAQLEDAERLLQAQLDQHLPPVAQAKLQASLVDLRAKIDAQQDVIDLRAATTPKTIVRRFDPLGAKTRKALLERAEGLEKYDRELAKLGIEGGQKQDLERLKIDAEKAKTAKQQERDIYSESAGLADKIAEKQAVITQIDDLVRDFEDGIPGVGAFKGTETAAEWAKGIAGGTNRAYQFKKRVRQIVERGLRDATGAAAPPAEQEAYVDFILEGSGDIGGEEKVWTNLRAFKENLANEVDARMRGRSEEAVEWFTRNKRLPELDPLSIGRAPTADVVTRK